MSNIIRTATRPCAHFAAVIAIAAVGVGGLAACTGTSGASHADAAKPVHGGNLVIDGTVGFSTLDKDRAATSNDALRLIENVYDRLYVLDSKNEPTPSLATSYTLSSDHLTWTFVMRKGVQFSDGFPVTGADVIFSLDLARKGPFLGSLYDTIASVTAPSAGVVVIKTATPDPALLQKLTLPNAGIIPNNYGGRKGTAFWLSPIASGPWMVQHYQQGVGVKLLPNPRYWGPKPYLSSIAFNGVPATNTRMLQLSSGQAQLVETPAYAQLASIAKNAQTTVLSFPSTEVDFVSLNTTKPPFNDVHFRRAISLAIDRASIVKAALLGHGEPATTWVSKEVLGGYQPAAGVRYDLAAAKRELAKSATPNGAHIKLLYTSVTPVVSTAAQVMQSDLKGIGVDLQIQNADQNTLGSAVQNKTFDMFFEVLTYDIPDPSENVGYYFQTHQFDTFDPATDVKNLLADASQVFGQKQRVALYRKVADALTANADTVSLYSVPYTWGASKRLHGMQQTVTGQFSFSELWLS